MHDAMAFVLHRKEGALNTLTQRLALYDPAKRSREGFGEIVKNGTRTPLSEIEVGETFEVVDDRVKIRAVGIEKVEIRGEELGVRN